MREFPKNREVSRNPINRANLHQMFHQKGYHLEELLLVLAEGQTSSMQSLAAKSKTTL